VVSGLGCVSLFSAVVLAAKFLRRHQEDNEISRVHLYCFLRQICPDEQVSKLLTFSVKEISEHPLNPEALEILYKEKLIYRDDHLNKICQKTLDGKAPNKTASNDAIRLK